MSTSTLHLGFFYMPQICNRQLYFTSEGRRAEDFFALKNPTTSAGFEPANLGTRGQHATPRPPKPLNTNLEICIFCQSLWRWLWMEKDVVSFMPRPVNPLRNNLRCIFKCNLASIILLQASEYSYIQLLIKLHWYECKAGVPISQASGHHSDNILYGGA